MIVRGSAVFPRYIGQISISIEVYRDMNVFKKIFGTSSQREVKAIMPLVDKVLALEEEYKALSDHELQAKTGEFKERLQKGETLDDILPRPSPPAGRPTGGCWACAPTRCRSSAASSCTRAASPR